MALVPLMQVPWTFDPQINLIAFAISAVIGVVFGVAYWAMVKLADVDAPERLLARVQELP